MSLFDSPFKVGDLVEHITGKIFKVKKVYKNILVVFDINFTPSEAFHKRNFDGTGIIRFENIKRKI